MEELNTLRKRPRASLHFLPRKDIMPLPCQDIVEASQEPSQDGSTISGLVDSKSVRNASLLFVSHPPQGATLL